MAHLLVIDDEDTFLDFLSQTLTMMGYQVKTAHSGHEAIEILGGGHEFDLVVTDVLMPETDGNAVAAYLRNSDKADTPIVGITGYADKVDKKLFDSILIKPFRVKDLITAIRSLIEDR